MVELDYDKVLEELINLVNRPSDTVEDNSQFPETLEQYLKNVAKTGDTIFPWSKVKPFIRKKMEVVIENFHEKHPLDDAHKRVPNCDPFDYEGIKMNILNSLDWFCAAPFTIQRLCELLTDPYRHYSRTDKFMRGIEKNVIVVSTVQPRPNKYSTPETIEKQPTFRDLYPQFSSSSSSRGRASSISGAMERSQTPPMPAASSCPSSVATSPSSNHANATLLTNGFNDNNGANNQGGSPLVHHHHGPPSHSHHHNHHPLSPHPKPPTHHSNRPFDGPYSMVHLANSNSPAAGLFYDGSSHHHGQTPNPPSSGSGGSEQQQSGATPNHYPAVGGTSSNSNTSGGLSAPLHQLDSFTSVFVATSYLTNQMNHSVSGSSGVTTAGSSPPSSSNELNQSSPQPHRTNWSPAGSESPHHRHFGSLISSSASVDTSNATTAAANDENENIVVDDEYEQHPFQSQPGSSVLSEVLSNHPSTSSESPEVRDTNTLSSEEMDDSAPTERPHNDTDDAVQSNDQSAASLL